MDEMETTFLGGVGVRVENLSTRRRLDDDDDDDGLSTSLLCMFICPLVGILFLFFEPSLEKLKSSNKKNGFF